MTTADDAKRARPDHPIHELLAAGNNGVRRISLARALAADTTSTHDYCTCYVDDLPSVLDLDAIRSAGVRIGADPLGGAAVDYWARIADRHRLDLTVVNPVVDPTWRFMTQPAPWRYAGLSLPITVISASGSSALPDTGNAPAAPLGTYCSLPQPRSLSSSVVAALP